MSKLEKEQTPGFLYLMSQISKMKRKPRSTRADIIKEIVEHNSVSVCEKTIERLFRLEKFLLKEKWTFEDQKDLHPPSTRTLNQLTRFYVDYDCISFKDFIEDFEEDIKDKGFLNKATEKALVFIFEKNDILEELKAKMNKSLGGIKDPVVLNENIKDLRDWLLEMGIELNTKKEMDSAQLVNGLIEHNLKIIKYLKVVSGLTAALIIKDIGAFQELFGELQDSVIDSFKGIEERPNEIKENQVSAEKNRLVHLDY